MATPLTITLDEFLLAHIAEDEERVRQAIGMTPWAVNPPNLFHHVALRHLSDCDAKRRLVELHQPDELAEGHCRTCWDDSSAYCTTLRLVALPYADHPDYREEWRP